MPSTSDARPPADNRFPVSGRRSRTPAPQDRRREKVVLIVDDLLDQRELYASYLAYLGYHVEEASSGVEGIAKAIELRPDIVIMDLAMPGLDGFDATRVLKAVGITKDIPVIALTAHGDHLPREWASIAGCDVYLRKPILPDDLAVEIDRILYKKRH